MKSTISTVAAGVAASLLACQGAYAVQQTQSPEEMERAEGIPATPHQAEAAREIESDLFTKLDEDGNGLISRQEAQGVTALSDKWSEYDEDADGALDSGEFGQFVQRMDAQHEAERTAQQGSAAEGLATTPHQEEAMEDDLVGQQEAERTAHQDSAAEGLPTTPHQEEAVEGDLVGQLDSDGDGTISQEEAQAEAKLAHNWDQYDANGDGQLDPQELDQFEQELREAEEAE